MHHYVLYGVFLMIKNILFDFDGVILDSMPVREYGFREIFKNFENIHIERLIDYHKQNQGLPRFNKIRYFFSDILLSPVSENQAATYAEKFSAIMKKELIKKKYIITQTLEFIKNNYNRFNLHIVSGSEETELKYLCAALELSIYFKSILGSPRLKSQLVHQVLTTDNYLPHETILIGDSVNDYEAALKNNIYFFGFNNTSLITTNDYYIESFDGLNRVLKGGARRRV